MRSFIYIVLSCFIALPAFAEKAAPTIVVTIRPLYALVSAVMEHRAKPHLLLSKNASPHHYLLTPNDVKTLKKADALIMIHPEFEMFLDSFVKNAPPSSVIITGLTPGLTLLPSRDHHAWQPHEEEEDPRHAETHDDHDHEDHEHNHDHHHHGGTDWHIWLSTHNAKLIVQELVNKLSAVDPAYTSLYRRNAKRLLSELDTLQRELRAQLHPYQHTPFLVFHDAYHYFEYEYTLDPIGTIMLHPDSQPGPKTIQALIDHVQKTNAICIFQEPQFSDKLVLLIQRETGIRSAVLDPEWGPENDITEKNPASIYPLLMKGLAKNLVNCFTDKK